MTTTELNPELFAVAAAFIRYDMDKGAPAPGLDAVVEFMRASVNLTADYPSDESVDTMENAINAAIVDFRSHGLHDDILAVRKFAAAFNLAIALCAYSQWREADLLRGAICHYHRQQICAYAYRMDIPATIR